MFSPTRCGVTRTGLVLLVPEMVYEACRVCAPWSGRCTQTRAQPVMPLVRVQVPVVFIRAPSADVWFRV